jgi:ATP-dependent helicase/DNAse subunit B
MMTIKQLSKRLYSLYGDKPIIARPLIPIIISGLSDRGMGFSSIISDFIEELKQYRPQKDIKAIMAEFKDVFSELGIPEDGTKRAMDAIELFRKYQELLNKHNALDENDLLRECPQLIKMHNYNPETLILDGFYELTPIEETVLKRLIEHSKRVFISIHYDANFTEITNSFISFLKNNFTIVETALTSEKKELEPPFHSYPGIDEEVEAIARHIKNLFISGKNRTLDNIIVTFPKLHIYSEIVERVFRRYGIPYTFSVSKPLGKTRPFLDLIAMLESAVDDYPRLPFSQFLISPYFKKMPEIFRHWIPSISLNSGIIKGKDSWLNLQNSELRKGHRLSEINKGLKWVFKKLAPLEFIKDKGTYRKICETLYKLLTELDFSDGGIDLKEQTTNILKELSLIDNFILPEVNNKGLRHFIDSLRHILNATETEIEGTGVQVIGFFELRGIEPEYLYMGGLRDGDLPLMPDIDHILPDSVRTSLGLVNMKRYLHLQRFIFQLLMDSSENLHLSYPAMEGDKLFLPSPFLPWKAEIREEIPGILCKEEELIRKGKDPLSSHVKEISNIKDKFIKKKYGEDSYIRVTDIDSYRTCPRKFFIEKILRLEPPEIKEYEVEARLLGTIIHKIMEELISRPFVSLDELMVSAEKILERLLKEQPVEDYWGELIKDSFLSILPEIYEVEGNLRDEGYSFMEAEHPVEGEVIKGIKLRGKIDRVDRKDNEVELIDYKTGGADLSRTKVIKNGANLQLFLYAMLMKLLGLKVSRAGIYSLKDLKITWVPTSRDRREGRTIEDYIEISLKYLEETISRLRKGDFTALPIDEQACRNCHERPYCPYIQSTGSFGASV